MALRLAFTDFWEGFVPEDEWFVQQLRRRLEFDIAQSPAEADVVVSSVFGHDHERFACTRVLLSWENRPWPRSRFDWAFTSDYHNSSRHHRLPLWVVHLDLHPERIPGDPASLLKSKSRFAATVVSNPTGAVRNRLHDALDSYREVASGGRFRNNVGGPVADKLEFLRTAKFSLACENSSRPGYTTEKIIHALAADTIPIYWGDPLIAQEFNPERFINVHDFASEKDVLAKVIELDTDEDAAASLLAQPWFRDGQLPAAANVETMIDHFVRAVAWTGTPVSRQARPIVAIRALTDRMEARRRHRARQA
ncbi:MAG TPA: hypothetical protein DCR14_14870 [Acidimicrobiaceae bacterium]|nr:hypothetical protein [Acidimicrobiaceae bacterium]